MRLPLASAAVVAVLVGPVSARAQQTYEDLSGRFVFEPPPGWKMSQDMGNDLRQFKGSGIEALFVGFLSAADRDALCQTAFTAMATSVDDHHPLEPAVDFALNGSPARWAVYTGKLKTSPSVALYNLAGCVLLPDADGGVYFFSILNEKGRAQLGAAIKTSFESIRAPGAQRTGIAGAHPAQPAEAVATSPTPFMHQLVSLTLPPGWTVVPPAANPDPDLIATFNLKEAGITAVLSGQEKYGDLNVIAQKVQGAIQTAVPNAKAAGEPVELVTAGGDKAVLQNFTGTLVSGGKEVALGAILVATRNDKRGLALQLYFPATSAERAGKEAAAIVQSIK